MTQDAVTSVEQTHVVPVFFKTTVYALALIASHTSYNLKSDI